MLKKRMLSMLIITAFVFTSVLNMTGMALANTQNSSVFSDIEGHWAEQTIKNHYSKGMLKGYPDGTFKPDRQMMRSELITLINRYFGLANGSEDNFKDVAETAWYAGETAKAKYYGYINSLNAEPDCEATREAVVHMLSLIIDIEEQKRTQTSVEFKDLEGLNSESRQNITDFAQMGYIKGYPDGTFAPDGTINRAEIMTLAESVLGYIVTSQEDLDNIPAGVKKITIINPNLKIENKTIDADIYISPGVNGSVIIKNCRVNGKIEISGGTSKNPVVLENVKTDKVVITKAKEKPSVDIISSDIDELKVKSETKVKADEKTTIGKAEIQSAAKIEGKADIKRAYVSSENVIIEKRPDYIEVKNNVTVDVSGNNVNERTDDKHSSSGGSKNTDPILTKIKQGYIPVANKAELLQINVSEANTFGAGTKYEKTYTGGPDKKYIQLADIDLAGDNFVPIGYDETSDTVTEFTGIFEGNGFTINNLNIERCKQYQGLFSKLGSGAVITDVTINNAAMKTLSNSGVLAGTADVATVKNSKITNINYGFFPFSTTSSVKTEFIGGFVGKAENTVFSELTLNGFELTATDSSDNYTWAKNIGGITGLINGGEIKNCTVTDIHLEAILDLANNKFFALVNTGGIAGELQNSSTQPLIVDFCTVSNAEFIIGGLVNGSDCSGGLVGKIDTADDAIQTNGDITVKNSTASGIIQGKGDYLGACGIGGCFGYVNGINTPAGVIQIYKCSAEVNVSELGIKPESADIADNNGIGGFAANLNNADVTDCYAAGNIESKWLVGAGGFAGQINNGTINNCSAKGHILGSSNNVGFAALIIDSEVNKCYAEGNVSVYSNECGGGYLGGFACVIYNETTISDCYYSGHLGDAVSRNVGGFAVQIHENATIQNCYTSKEVRGAGNNIYTFVFDIEDGAAVTNCYYNKTANPEGVASNSVIDGIKGITFNEFTKKATFADWDISDVSEGQDTIWKIKEDNTYPYLAEPEPIVTGIEIKTAPNKAAYTEGEPLDLTGLAVTLTKSDETYEDVAFEDFAEKSITTEKANGDDLTAADTEFTITHTESGASINQTITVEPSVKHSITLGTVIRPDGDEESTITLPSTSAREGETVTLTVVPKAGMILKPSTLKAVYNDGTEKEIPILGPEYTFEMPAYDVTITAEFMELEYTNVYFTEIGGESNGLAMDGWFGSQDITDLDMIFGCISSSSAYFKVHDVQEGTQDPGVSFYYPNAYSYFKIFNSNNDNFNIIKFNVYNPNAEDVSITVDGWANLMNNTPVPSTGDVATKTISAAANSWTTVELNGFNGILTLTIDFEDNTPLYFNQFYIAKTPS